MTQTRREGGRGTFLGLSIVILGGLLFAAGVMVGRQLKIQESPISKNRLEQIDERDRKINQIDTDTLTFHEELSKPPKLRKEFSGSSKPTPKTIPKPTQEPTPKATPFPDPTEIETGKIKLQVASFGEPSKAKQLTKRLFELGYRNTEVVEGNVGGRTYFRVRVGPYLNRQAADRVIENLRSDGLEAIMVLD